MRETTSMSSWTLPFAGIEALSSNASRHTLQNASSREEHRDVLEGDCGIPHAGGDPLPREDVDVFVTDATCDFIRQDGKRRHKYGF